MFGSTQKKKAKLAEENKTIINYGVKMKAYPTDKQSSLMNQTFGCSRIIYNKSLDYKKTHYDLYNQNVSYGELEWYIVHFYKQSEEYAFLKDIDKFAITSAIENLFTAYKNFFEGNAKFPKFKTKQNSYQSYTTKFTNNNIQLIINDENLFVKLPKVGKVLVHINTNTNEKVQKVLNGQAHITKATVSMHNYEYFISLTVEEIVGIVKKTVAIKATDITAGDLGIKTLVDLYDGENHTQVENPKWTNKNEKKTKKLQRRLSRKKKGSNNYNKTKKKFAKHSGHVANQRMDFNHKLSRRIANESQVYISEDLNIKGMLKNHKLAKQVQSCGWNQLQKFIQYKVEWKGGYFIKVDQFFPSSKLCHECGHKNMDLTLNDREWTCPNCGKLIKRDENASENLYSEGITILKEIGIIVIQPLTIMSFYDIIQIQKKNIHPYRYRWNSGNLRLQSKLIQLKTSFLKYISRERDTVRRYAPVPQKQEAEH